MKNERWMRAQGPDLSLAPPQLRQCRQQRSKLRLSHHGLWLCGLLLVWLLGGGSAWAGPLSQRLATFPNWEERPIVQAAVGDLYYPDWAAGTWDVATTLVDMVAPLAPNVVTPGFESNRSYLNQPIRFQARFVPEQREPPSWLPISIPRTPPIVADRAFNGENLAHAYLDSPTGQSPVLAVKVDPENPNRQLTVLQGKRLLVSTVTARATERPDDNQFITTEIFQQEFRSSPQIYLNQVETTTAYQRFPETRPGEPSLTADQVTAIYLSPQDPDFTQAGDRPVALYRYRLEFYPANSDETTTS
ncbi:DUF6816 family protein [Leptolyngbya sp. FACHB-16]|uniref:DUF6816 family protein n=3 Tax=Leptolyngbya TaxID=47251 RepID=UPI001F54C0A4|nr:hypothetical protein [Leptolyngbya sp. FACHB-16]